MDSFLLHPENWIVSQNLFFNQKSSSICWSSLGYFGSIITLKGGGKSVAFSKLLGQPSQISVWPVQCGAFGLIHQRAEALQFQIKSVGGLNAQCSWKSDPKHQKLGHGEHLLWEPGLCWPCPLLDIVLLFLIPFQLPLNTGILHCSLFEDT